MSGGGSLGLGSNKQDANSQSTSYGWSESESQDNAASSSVSGGTSATRQNLAFADIFERMYGGATGAADKAIMSAPELRLQAQQLFTGGMGILDSLGGDAGSQYMNDALGDEDALLNQQIDLLREDTGRLFTDELNPAITSRAVAGGSLGGGRQGVAQALAMEAAQREFTKGSVGLRVASQDRKDRIAAEVAGNTLTAANTGLGALPGLLDMFERGENAELGVYNSLSGILGGPTVLSQSDSSDFSRASSIAEAFSRSFGENSSQSTSRSRGRAWNFDMSGYGGVGAGGMSGG
jgi:hypothetical protein